MPASCHQSLTRIRKLPGWGNRDWGQAAEVKYGKGLFPWAASGRSLSLGRDDGLTKLIFDETTERIIGAGSLAPTPATS